MTSNDNVPTNCSEVENSNSSSTLPLIHAAISDASTVLMESAYGSDSDAETCTTDIDKPNLEAEKGATPSLRTVTGQEGTSSSPMELHSASGFTSPVNKESSPDIVALPAIEINKECNPANQDDGGIGMNHPSDAKLGLPTGVEGPLAGGNLNPFEGFVDTEPQTSDAFGSDTNPFNSPMTRYAFSSGIVPSSRESSPESFSDMAESCNSPDSIDPLHISNIPPYTPTSCLPELENSSLNAVSRRPFEVISLEDSFVFPSLQTTMASLQKSATPSKTQSMNLPSPPENKEGFKHRDRDLDTSGMLSAPATVADIPHLLIDSSSPPKNQAELPPPPKDFSACASGSSSWEGFDILDAAQMELASIIKETRCIRFDSFVVADNMCLGANEKLISLESS